MKHVLLIFLTLCATYALSQELVLPEDFRQHNITEYNSSFFNPAYSVTRNNPESVAFWTRWQWQSIDSDPTTYFLSYSRKINQKSAFAVAFFQHNTGVFLNTGGAANYAYAFNLSDGVQLLAGLNLYGFQKTLADDQFEQDPDMMLPLPDATNDFVIQFNPGLLLMVNQFELGLASDNLISYNFGTNGSDSPDGKVVLLSAGYTIPVSFFNFDDNASIRPLLYYKTIPSLDNQLGINALMSTSKFWVQAGYNNFYGISAGAGGRFFQKLSLGALVEFGTSSDLDGFDPTIELAAAFFIGPWVEKKQPPPVEEEEPEEIEEDVTEAEEEAKAAEEANAEAEEQARLEEEARLQEEAEAKAKAEEQARIDEQARFEEEARAREAAIAAEAELKRQREAGRRAEEEARKRREAFVKDSLEAARLAEAEAIRKQKELEEIAQSEEAQPQEGEKYQEALSEDGLQPGYYLVANVFGTKRYFEAFMKTLADGGLEPKSFYRSVNKYNYVYLERYDTMQQARQARDSKFNGRYEGDTWIFRVVSN